MMTTTIKSKKFIGIAFQVASIHSTIFLHSSVIKAFEAFLGFDGKFEAHFN